MSSMLEDLMGQIDGESLDALSRQIGADRKQTKNGIAAALPMIIGALSRNSQSGSGAEALGAALDRDHDGSILNNVGAFLGQGDTSPGASILAHIFGGKRSRIESGLSQTTGISSSSTGKILALLAPLVLGALGKAKREGNMDASQLAGMLNRERAAIEQKSPQQLNILNTLLDADGDGDVDLSDIIQKGGGLLGRLFGKR